jgi:hypothetical protein
MCLSSSVNNVDSPPSHYFPKSSLIDFLRVWGHCLFLRQFWIECPSLPDLPTTASWVFSGPRSLCSASWQGTGMGWKHSSAESQGQPVVPLFRELSSCKQGSFFTYIRCVCWHRRAAWVSV